MGRIYLLGLLFQFIISENFIKASNLVFRKKGLHDDSIHTTWIEKNIVKNTPASGQYFPSFNIKTSSNNVSRLGNSIKSVVIPGIFGVDVKIAVNWTIEYLVEYIYNTTDTMIDAIRITVSSPNSGSSYPVLVVIRQQRGVLSCQLPMEPPPNTFILEEYRTISRTLCPVKNYKTASYWNIDAVQRIFVDVSTSSQDTVDVFVKAVFKEDFHIQINSSKTFVVTPAEPAFYEFKFPEDVDFVLVKATSQEDYCAKIAIQNISCPVFDTETTVNYAALYQSMILKAGITVRKEHYPEGFYIIAVALSSDELCSGSFLHVHQHRYKTITLTVNEKITQLEYLSAIFAGFGFCAIFYIVSLIFTCVSYRSASLNGVTVGCWPLKIELGKVSTCIPVNNNQALCDDLPSDSSLDEDDIDMLNDAETHKDIFRTKTFLYVSDLAKKNVQVLKRKTRLYVWNLITIGIFYAVPVVQLVITYQKVLDDTGDQDSCYYNFLCAHPWGPFSDFNHIFSNIGYILFGILFIAFCYQKDKEHQKSTKVDRRLDKYYGIPQHFGLFYAMGGALIMEGLMSACYHICPNHSNFQFDTAFMYIIAVLCMLKIYQTRHPDINASASGAYLCLAFAVLVGVIGVLQGSVYFWILFGFAYIIICWILSASLYYMGRWSLDFQLTHRIVAWFRTELSDIRHILRPMYLDRMILLLIGNGVNWGLAFYGMIQTPGDFASYLVIIFLTNLLLYTTFYIIMKLRHGECILIQPLAYLILCFLSWGVSSYFFLQRATSWKLSPSHSRQFNRECSLLNFYDTHDIWHFLSAAAMFFAFMLLLTLDDDLILTPREKIPVF